MPATKILGTIYSLATKVDLLFYNFLYTSLEDNLWAVIIKIVAPLVELLKIFWRVHFSNLLISVVGLATWLLFAAVISTITLFSLCWKIIWKIIWKRTVLTENYFSLVKFNCPAVVAAVVVEQLSLLLCSI